MMSHKVSFGSEHISPSKVVCVGRNYVDHIHELGNAVPTEPVIFIKPNSAITKNLCTHDVDEIHYEGEISFLINQGIISGVGFGLDLTKRKIQSVLKEKSLPWERAKAFDGSAVFSEFVPVDQHLSDLRMELFINDSLTQSSGYSYMLHKPEVLIQDINSFMTLEDGDIVMSGTPKGVGQLFNGDTFIGKIYNGDKLLIQSSWQVKQKT